MGCKMQYMHAVMETSDIIIIKARMAYPEFSNLVHLLQEKSFPNKDNGIIIVFVLKKK